MDASSLGRGNVTSPFVKGWLLLSGVLTLVFTVGMLLLLVIRGVPGLLGGAAAPRPWLLFAGTLAVVGAAAFVSAPLALLTAVFLQCAAPRPLAAAVRGVFHMLAGLPGVVYGLAVLGLLTRFLGYRGVGASALAASVLLLAAMMLPEITLTADKALSRLPLEPFGAALALGATPLRAMFGVYIPFAARRMLLGVLCAMGRAGGESLGVLLVAGAIPPLLGPQLFKTLEAGRPNLACSIALVLCLWIFLLQMLGRLLRKRV